MKGKFKLDGKKGFVIAIILVVLIIGYYFYLSNREVEPKEEEVKLTQAQELLLRDLDRNYPPTPKEVVKYYFQITKCLYNEDLSEEDIEALALKLAEMFDDELAANQVEEEYFENLKNEIMAFKNGNMILNYSTSSSTDVDYFNENGRECARLYGTFYLQVNKKMNSLEEVFVLRKDDEGHWKLYGWDTVSETQTQVTGE